jgi:6-phosphogluconolactonase (cycloisomerase 2 family)
MLFLSTSFHSQAGMEFVDFIQDGQNRVEGLDSANFVAMSPDNQFVYVASDGDNALTVLIRNPTTGELVPIQVIRNVEGLNGVQAVTVSSDNQSVYVVSSVDDAVVVFKRDPSNNLFLKFQQALKDNQDNIDGLDGAQSITMSADNRSVYVASKEDNAVTVFSRDLSSGELTFQDVIKVELDGQDDIVNVLEGAASVTVSADDQSVYVASEKSNIVSMFSRDLSNGLLTFQEFFQDGQDGIDGLDGAKTVTVSSDDQSIYVASKNDNAVAVFSRDLNNGQLTFQQSFKDGQNGVDGLNGAQSVTVSTDNQSVYVASLKDDAVAIFSRELGTGKLTFQEVLKNGQDGIEGLDGVRAITISNNDQSVYVASRYDSAVVVLWRDPGTGKLTFQQILKNDQASIDGLDGAKAITVSPDDKSIYVAAMEDSAVAVFSRVPDTNELIFQQIFKDEQIGGIDKLSGARAIRVSADGQSVYVASFHDNALVVFSRDPDTGLLTFQKAFTDGQDDIIDGLDGVREIAISADDQSVYVVSDKDDAVAVFERNLSTGELTFQQVINNQAGVTGLNGANSITVSADHKSVYVASVKDKAIAVFSRNLSTGLLEFQQVYSADQTGIDGLDGAKAITMSADDRSVYVASWIDNAVVAFLRDPSTGLLTFQQLFTNDDANIDGLDGAYSVTVSADDQSVYVTGFRDNAVAVFGRDPSTGQLAFQQAIFDEINHVNGLAEANSVAISHDDRFVYVASSKDDAIAIFERTNHPPLNILPSLVTLQNNTPTTLNLDLVDDDAAPFFPLQVTLVATNGTLSLNYTDNLTFKKGDGQDDSQLVVIGKLADLQAALQGITFTPTPNFSGKASLEMISDDLGHSGYGGAKQDQDIITFTITFDNNQPVVETMATQYGFPEQLLQLQITATDSDIPKQTLNYRLEDPPAGATIGFANGQLSWTPSPEQIGTFNMKVVVNDGIDDSEPLVFKVVVTDKPKLSIADQTAWVANPFTLPITATFFEQQALSYRLKNTPAGASIDEQTGVLTWTPTQTGQFPFTVVVTESLSQYTAETTFTVTVALIDTHLNLNLQSPPLFQNSQLQEVKGKLSSYLYHSSGLNNLAIQLIITAPDGQTTTLTTTVATNGEYRFTQLPALTQIGQYRLQTQWLGNDYFAASQSKPQTVSVNVLAGYALLVEGRDAQGSGEQAYNKTLNRVYRKLKYRGFIDKHIEYLSYEAQPETDIHIDARPNKARIQAALQTLSTLLNNDPAPLFITMVDHGSIDGQFYLDNGDGETISPTELNSWLTALEQDLNPQALLQPRVVIIGACYSGSFLSTLSQPGRIIVTSTAVGEESYKGPKEPDEVRSGEYFIEALFAHLGQGNSLAKAFELANYSTKNFTRKDDFTYFNKQFQDHAVQHPLLDDNSDQQGSNWLGSDGQQAKHIYLGLGPQNDANAPDSPATILAVTPTLHLDANTSVAQLSAWSNHPNRVKDQQVLVDIRPPSLQLTAQGIEHHGQLQINGLQRIQLPLTTGNHFQSQVATFTEAGQYELFYFVIDNQTGEISPLQRSSVYKDKLHNQLPTAVQLRSPANGSETPTIVIFDWEASQDPDHDPVTYTLLLGTDPTLQTSVYQQAGLTTSMTYLNSTAVINDPLNQGQPGLRDGTDYFWKVQAIDKYGAIAESSIFAFQTNDTNFPPSLGSLYVYNAVDFVSLENATLDFWVIDEIGNLVLDNGLPVPLSQPPDVYKDQGFYNMTLPYGRRRATIHVSGYQEQDVLIDTTDGLANLRVAMTPTGGIATQPGQLQFRVTQARFEETQGQIAILVDRVGGADGAVAVTYELLPDTSASLDSDFNVATGQLTWANQDSSSKKIPLTIHDDDQPEGTESFTLRLNNPTGNATLKAPATLTITLIDDETTLPQEPGVLQFLTTHYTASESDSKPMMTVTRTNGSEGQVTVQYLVTNESTAQLNTDYTGGTGTLTWDDGDDEPKRLQLTLVDDTDTENLETLNFTLVNPTKGATLGEHQSTALTITDNDVAGVGTGVVQFAQSDYQAHEEDSFLKTVTVTRTGGNQGQVSVHYEIVAESTATVGKDYLLGNTDLLTWPAGDSEAKIINITIIDDSEIEVAETVQFRLINPTGGVVLGQLNQATLAILDNDSTTEDKPNNPTAENKLIDQTVEDKSTTLISGDILNKLAAENKPASVVEETTLSQEELGNSTTIDSDGTHSNSTTTRIAGTLQFFTDTYYLNEGIGPVSTFTVTRTNGSQGAVSVEYTTTAVGTADIGLDYVGGSGLITWADGDDTPKAIEIQIIDDLQSEGPETIQLQLENPTDHAQLGIDDSATLIITDNDLPTLDPEPSQSDTAVLQFESALHWTQEEDGKINLKVTRTGNSQGEVAVDYLETLHSNAAPGEDYLNGSGSLVWADGDNQPQTITLDLIDDDFPESEYIHLVLVEPLGQAVLGKQSETLVILQDRDAVNSILPQDREKVNLTAPKEANPIQLDQTTIQLVNKPVEIITESQSEVLISVIRTGTQGQAAVNYETIAGSATANEDYLLRQGRLIWQAGEEGVVNLIIPIVVDSQLEPEESFMVRLVNPSEGVQLGNLSQVEIRIQDDPTISPPPLLLPNLGRGMAIANDPSTLQIRYDCQALSCPLNATFRGGSSLDGLSYYQQLTLHPRQYVNIRGEIDVAAEHVGQPAELLVVAAWHPLDSLDPEHYFMQDDQGHILPWNLNLAQLVTAQAAVTLTSTQKINLYTGFLKHGQIRLFFGYQLPDEVIVFNGEQAVELVVKDFPFLKSKSIYTGQK